MNHRGFRDIAFVVGALVLAGVFVVLSDIQRKRLAKNDGEHPSVHEPVEDLRASVELQSRELSIWNRAAAYPGFTIVPQSGTELVELLNMEGQVVHTWEFDAARARLLPNCNLLVVHGSKWGLMREPWRELRHNIREYNWNGDVVWEYVAPGPGHHDVQRLANGNTLFLYRVVLPEEKVALIKDKNRREAENRSDAIMEVTPEGEVAWHWNIHDHFDPNFCGAEVCPKVLKKVKKGNKEYDWTHSNAVTVIPENRWFAGGDKRFRPGNIMILIRNWSSIFVIDKENGEPVWSYHGDYKGGLSGGHEAFMIEPHLPGAGNVLVFDNGRDKGTSFALEVNPVTKETVWVYDVGQEFYSEAAGTLQRLPNGNTLISEDV